MKRPTTEWCQDIEGTTWIGPRLHPFGQDTGSVIPEGFEAYCRVFHPVEASSPDQADRRWAEVAAENGRIAHRQMQLHMISRPPGAPEPLNQSWDVSWGTCPLQVRESILEVLARHTTTADDVWFCVWEGFGGFGFPRAPRLRLPNRDYLVYRGPLGLALLSPDPRLDLSASLWWPADRSWIVATEVDFAWTYIGGTESLIGSVLALPTVEALRAELSDEPFYGSDLINQALDP